MAAKKTANKPAPSKPVTRGGALSTNPSKPRTDPKVAQQKARDTYLTTVRNLGNLTVGSPEYNAALATVNKTGKQLGYKEGRINTAINKYAQKGTPGAPAGTPEAAFRGLTPEGQIQETGTDALALQNEAYRREMERMRQGQPDFSSQLESSRQQAMGQFERTMGPEFERQQMQLRQRMSEQGIDPNSGAYQAQMKMLNDAQGNARQNAMSQAFTQGAEYQQQGFTQDVTSRTMPFQFAQMGADAWKLPYAAKTQAEQAALDRASQERAARSGGGSAVAAARISADAARDIAAMEGINRYTQPKQPSPGSALAQGLGTGVGAAATRYATS